MSDTYLPIKESLGYKNVKQALWKVFLADLDTIPIQEGEFENFSFPFSYNNYEMTMLLSSTEKRHSLILEKVECLIFFFRIQNIEHFFSLEIN